MKLFDEVALTAKIEAELPSIIQTVDRVARPNLAAYQKIEQTSRQAGMMVIGGFVGFVIGASIGSIAVVAGGLIFFGMGTVRFVRFWRQTDLRNQADQFPIMAHTTITEAVYGLVGFLNPKLISHAVTWNNRWLREVRSNPNLAKYVAIHPATAGSESIRPLVDASELITELANGFSYDDVVTFTWQGQTATVGELDVSHTTGSGKNSHTKHIFKGLFLHIPTTLTSTGKTFLSTDGDRNGFGHQSFWSNLTGTHGVAETTLEWNEFEDAFHVATDNPMEARYILTPDFMHVLYEFWQRDKRNIRISIIGSQFYVLCPISTIRMYGTIKDLAPDTIKNEVVLVTKALVPLFQLLQVIETRVGKSN